MNNNNENFSSVYSANQNDEVLKILKKYQTKNEVPNDFEKLKALDKKVESPAKIISLCFGIIGCLILGAAMSFILLSKVNAISVIAGIAGIGIILFAYPVYKKVQAAGKAKYAEQIISLAQKLKSNN